MNFIHGKCLIKYYCKDCGKQVSGWRYKRCIKCNQLFQVGKNNGRYINGKCLIESFCIDCNKKLNFLAVYYGIKRCHSCSRKEYLKDPTKHPNYIDGRSLTPYPTEFNSKLKDFIRDRDNHICQNPDCNCTEKQNRKALDVHHIDYNKENCLPENLISLCSICNVKANYNRDYYYALFSYIINQLVGLLQ